MSTKKRRAIEARILAEHTKERENKMQSYDDQHKMIDASIIGDPRPFEDQIRRIQEEIQKKRVAEVVIGKLPNKGDSVTINGLVYLVKFVDYKRGTLQLRIKKYEEDTETDDGITHEAGEIQSV